MSTGTDVLTLPNPGFSPRRPWGVRRPERRPGHGSRAGKSHRSFDPVAVGTLESTAWAAYYNHAWLRFLATGLVTARRCFGLSWIETVRCSWYVLRANQKWAPYPDNDPEAAREIMERFYRIVRRRTGERFDPRTAAALDVEWWRVHRLNQYGQLEGGEPVLIDALARLYAYVYDAPDEVVRPAAVARARAMAYSDEWVAAGRPGDSPLVEAARHELITSYGALLEAVR